MFYQGTLSVFTNENGGIIDDLIVTRSDEQNYLYLVTNAGCRDVDIPHMKAREAEMKRYKSTIYYWSFSTECVRQLCIVKYN